ncbi:putative site-specific integrase-resolvase [Mycolicibacterium iranicum]|uniref:Putative site-specific integrase-resolvase n=1 Tax=Mycolicibacterium iranicum TaxID=912594 RepID=A0A839Q8K0_MYCIR|nr:putative site-specific integrase-resolvase [Mycolicibacterium iranicum]
MTSTLAPPSRLTLQEFADRERVSLSTVRTWVSNGVAPVSYRMNKRRVFDLSDVAQWEANLKASAR